MTTEAETGATCLQAGKQEPPVATTSWTRREGASPETQWERGPADTCLGGCGPQTVRADISVASRHPACGHLLRSLKQFRAVPPAAPAPGGFAPPPEGSSEGMGKPHRACCRGFNRARLSSCSPSPASSTRAPAGLAGSSRGADPCLPLSQPPSMEPASDSDMEMSVLKLNPAAEFHGNQGWGPCLLYATVKAETPV